ncbi:PP2C family protein-serine/threonine phosphatase [Streptomyces sp. WG-D5]
MQQSAGHGHTGQLAPQDVTVSAGSLRLIARHVSPVTGPRPGGDLFGVVPTSDGVRLIVGDVMGHGAAAHETATDILRAWQTLARSEPTLTGIAHRLHSFIDRSTQPERFVTAVLGTVRPALRSAELLHCGHPPPLVLRGASAVFTHALMPAPPLGLLDLSDGRFATHHISFDADDRLLFYTDGVTEARDPLGHDYPLATRAAALHTGSPATHLGRLESDLLRHTGGLLADDALLLLLEHQRG